MSRIVALLLAALHTSHAFVTPQLVHSMALMRDLGGSVVSKTYRKSTNEEDGDVGETVTALSGELQMALDHAQKRASQENKPTVSEEEMFLGLLCYPGRAKKILMDHGVGWKTVSSSLRDNRGSLRYYKDGERHDGGATSNWTVADASGKLVDGNLIMEAARLASETKSTHVDSLHMLLWMLKHQKQTDWKINKSKEETEQLCAALLQYDEEEKTDRKEKPTLFKDMSKDCVAGVHKAVGYANEYGLPHVSTECMLAGLMYECDISSSLYDTFKIFGLSIWNEGVLKNLYSGGKYAFHFALSGEKDNDQHSMAPCVAAAAESARMISTVFRDENENLSPLLARLTDEKVPERKTNVIKPSHFVLALLMPNENGEETVASKTVEFFFRSAGNFKHVTADEIRSVLLEKMESGMTWTKLCDQMQGGDKADTSQKGYVDTPTLSKYGTDLTKQARDGKLDTVHGREKEMRSCLRTLLRRRKNNPVLVGPPGTGKTAICEALAQLLVSTSCPPQLNGTRIMSLETGSLVAGTMYRGQFEERFKNIIKEASDEDAPPTIVFFDELHTVLGAGSTSGSPMDAANMLKPALARGELQVIGATTTAEYNKYVASDGALERRFQPVYVKEPNETETLAILQGLAPIYERHHWVSFSPESLETIVEESGKHFPRRSFPDKAIDLMDEAASEARLDFVGKMENDSVVNSSDKDVEALLEITPAVIRSVVEEITERSSSE